MTEFTYREGPREGPFYSVKGMVDYFSVGTASPKGSGPEFGLSKSKLRDQDKSSLKKVEANESETRDDCTKRVMFHPAIVSGESGEDLHFDETKVYTPNHRQDSNDDEQRDERSILSKKHSVTTPNQNLNMTENDVYTGMSWRCRADLLRDNHSAETNDSRRGRTTKNGQVKKIKKTKTIFAPAVPPPRNYLPVIQEDQTNFEATKQKGGPLSPKIFSVSKIRQARSGPVPKSDDFFSELKQWHKDYSLRQVGKPSEISIITASKAENDMKEDEDKKAEVKREIKKAAVEAKKALAKVNKDLSKKKKEEKVMKKKAEKEAQKIVKENEANESQESANEVGSGKKKKKFWKIPKIPGRKNKSKSKNQSTNQSTNSMSSTNSVEASTNSSLPSIPQKYPSLGLSKKPTKVPMKEPAFNDTLDKFLQLQLEMREEKELSVSDKKSRSSMSSDGTSTNASTNAIHQRAITNTVVVETVYSSEEETSVENSTVSKPKIEPEEVKADDQNESAPELEQSESWLEKAAGFFKQEEKEEPLSVVTKFDEDKDSIKGRDPTPTNEVNEAEKEEEIEGEEKEQPSNFETAVDSKEMDPTDPWIENIAGFFKKDKLSGPPVNVVEVDQFDVDKYEAFVETKMADKDDCINSEKNIVDKSEAKSIENEKQDGKSVRFTESTNGVSLDEDEAHVAGGFMQSHCPCVTGQQQSNHIIESDQKGSSWLGLGLGLASAYFMTNNETEAPKEEAETEEEIEKKQKGNEKDLSPTLASPDVEEPMNPSQSGTFDGSVPSFCESNKSNTFETNPEGTFNDSPIRNAGTSMSSTFEENVITKEDSFNNSLLTNEEGTKVTKIEADEGSKSSKIEPSGSKMDKSLDLEANRSSQIIAAEDGQTESRPCADSLPNRCIATESLSCADSKHKDDPSEDESKNHCVSKSQSKTSEALSRKSNQGAKPTDMVILRKKSKKSNVEKDTENCGLQTNTKIRNASISKKTAKKTVAKGQKKMGATLFGRLEPSPDTKKRKKKGKAQTLF